MRPYRRVSYPIENSYQKIRPDNMIPMVDKFCSLWFRLLRKTYPWLHLVATVWRLVFVQGSQRQREQLRFWMLVVKIDFANLIATAIDLCQPEYWV